MSCKRGMASTVEGARRMAKVLEAAHNGALHQAMPRRAAPPRRRAPLKRFVRTHAADATVGVDASSAMRAPFVNHGSKEFGPVLRRIGRRGTVRRIN